MKRLIRGLHDHPGTIWLVWFAIMGWIAAKSWWGAAIMLSILGPCYLLGAWERGGLLAEEAAKAAGGDDAK